MEQPTKIPLDKITGVEQLTTISNRQQLENLTSRHIELKKFCRQFQWYFFIFSWFNCAEIVAAALLAKSLLGTHSLAAAGLFMCSGASFAGTVYLLSLLSRKTAR